MGVHPSETCPSRTVQRPAAHGSHRCVPSGTAARRQCQQGSAVSGWMFAYRFQVRKLVSHLPVITGEKTVLEKAAGQN